MEFLSNQNMFKLTGNKKFTVLRSFCLIRTYACAATLLSWLSPFCLKLHLLPLFSGHQIRVRNWKLLFLFLNQNIYVVGTQKDRLNETVLLNTQNIYVLTDRLEYNYHLIHWLDLCLFCTSSEFFGETHLQIHLNIHRSSMQYILK